MNILYCGDSNISEGVIMSTLSLLENTAEELHIFILTMLFETEKKTYYPFPVGLASFLDKTVKEKNPKNTVTLCDITDIFTSCPPTANLETRFTPCCMLRLYADLVPEIPAKILYLDNDVICLADCSEFYDQDMDGVEISGVLDRYGKWFFKKNYVTFDYLNSGVLLMNLDEIRKNGFFEKCRAMCRDKEMLLPDQAALNKLAKKKRICKGKYNEQRKIKKSTVFRHYTTFFRIFPRFRSVTVKPWQLDRVHEILKSDECDRLYGEYQKVFDSYKKSTLTSSNAN